MHTPPREWSPSIQWAELPTVELTLGDSKRSTPLTSSHSSPQINHNNRHSPALTQEGEPCFVLFFKDFSKSPTASIQTSGGSGVTHSSLMWDVARTFCPLTLSDFKGLILVWSAQERDGLTAGLFRKPLAQGACQWLGHSYQILGVNYCWVWFTLNPDPDWGLPVFYLPNFYGRIVTQDIQMRTTSTLSLVCAVQVGLDRLGWAPFTVRHQSETNATFD